MTVERKYFVAAGKSLEAVARFFADRKAAGEARWEFVQKMGAKGGWGNDLSFIGLVIDPTAPVPEGWRESERSTEHRVIIPDQRRKAGKLARREMDDKRFLIPDYSAMGDYIGGDWVHAAGMMHFTTVEKIGEEFVIAVPVETDGTFHQPEDARPIKQSEYWLMKENAAVAV
jgi:hypothetical protein